MNEYIKEWCINDQHMKEGFHLGSELTKDSGSMKLGYENYKPWASLKMKKRYQQVERWHLSWSQKHDLDVEYPKAINFKVFNG